MLTCQKAALSGVKSGYCLVQGVGAVVTLSLPSLLGSCRCHHLLKQVYQPV